ncbi:MAG: PH domain-containing protein, partial [Actinomycetales bacterium]
TKEQAVAVGRIIDNASVMDMAEMDEKWGRILAHGEKFELGYKTIRDRFMFTNYRVILVDVQGVTGSKVDYHSVPYRAITQFSLETAGTADLDGELKFWVSSQADPYVRKLGRGVDLFLIQALLAGYIAHV